MPSSLFFFICALIFSLPALMLCVMMWPIFPGRPIPDVLNTDAAAIATIATLFGLAMSALLAAQLRRQDR